MAGFSTVVVHGFLQRTVDGRVVMVVLVGQHVWYRRGQNRDGV